MYLSYFIHFHLFKLSNIYIKFVYFLYIKVFVINLYRLTHNKQEISILNEKDEIEVINFSSNEMLEMVQLEDSTV